MENIGIVIAQTLSGMQNKERCIIMYRAIRKVISILPFIILSAITAYGAPSISNVDGTIQNGQTITINGSLFGAKANAAPLISTYDHPVAANNLSNGSIGGGWSTRGEITIGSDSSYRRTQFYQNTNYVNCLYGGDYDQLQYNGTTAMGTRFYVSFWYYVTSTDFTVSAASGNSKVWRWYTSSSPSTASIQELYSKVGGGSADSYRASKDGGQGSTDNWSSPFFPQYRTWNHVEGYIYAGTSGNTDGSMRTVLNGRSRMNWTGFGLISSNYPHNINYFRFGQVSGDNYTGGSILLSDVYIDNTQAHVFVSNRSEITDWLTNPTVTSNETQVCTAWSNNQIRFVLNQGNFNNGNTVYLYVVDANGGINTQGYPITIGNTPVTPPPTTDTTPPSPPTGVSITIQ